MTEKECLEITQSEQLPNSTTTAIGTGDNIVDKNYLDKVMAKSNINYNYGWICPRCGKVLAPDVKECTCKPEPKSNADNLFYKAYKNGVCQSTSKLSSCPQYPNYDICHNCPNWFEIIPL